MPFVDTTKYVLPFRLAVVRAFHDADFLRTPSQESSRSPDHIILVKTVHILPEIPAINPNWKRSYSLRFDAKPVLNKHKDFVWTDEFRLEELTVDT